MTNGGTGGSAAVKCSSATPFPTTPKGSPATPEVTLSEAAREPCADFATMHPQSALDTALRVSLDLP